MTPTPRPTNFRVLALTAGLAAVLFAGSCDSPVCVFGGNCFADPVVPPGALGASAVEPIEGELVLSGPPTVTSGAPAGMDRNSATPIVLFFSETMAPDSVTDAFELVEGASMLPISSDNFLFGDGRALVMLPRMALDEGDYSVQLVDGANPVDLGGTAVDFDASADLPAFSVGGSDPDQPVVVATFPPDGATNQSSTTEVVAIFDRAVDPPVALATGWDVTVRPVGAMTGSPPAVDPDPSPFQTPGFFGLPVDEPRIWTWQSFDGTDPVRLGTSASEVTVSISPVGSSFTDAADATEIVDQEVVTFTLSSAPRPMGGLLNPGREPQDAIGIANLDGITAALDLELQVDFEADDLAMDGDVLTVFLFGPDPDDVSNTIAFSRSITISTPMPLMSASMMLAELDLTTSTMPLEARFADGRVRVAMRLERAGDEGYLRLLDVDLVEEGTQDPVLDTVRPELLLLDAQMDDTDDYLSDLADLVVAGHADVEVGDFIRGAEVTTTGMGDNIATPGVVPEVLGSSDSLVDTGSGPTFSSFFLAAPVAIGRLDAASAAFDVTVTVYDRALNASETSLTVPFRQRGSVGTTPLDPTDPTPLVVEVFDAETLLGIENALVYSHAEFDDGMGTITYPMLSGGGLMTDAAGVVTTVPHHDATQVSTLVTVVAAGYDVVTFHGVPTTRLSVPLRPTQQVPGTLTDSVVTDPSVNLTALARRVGDTRRSELLFPTVATSALPGNVEYDFTIDGLRPFRLGAESFTAGLIDNDPANAGKDRLVKAFDLRVPIDGQEAAVQISSAGLRVERLLDDPDAPAAEVAKSVADVMVDATALMGMNPENLEDDVHYGRQPLVAVEATMPGVDAPIQVGMGTAYDVMGNPRLWDLRSAYAGAADPATGTLQDALEPDLHLRVELRGEDMTTMLPSGTSGMRPDISQLTVLDPLPMPSVPALTSIPTDGSGVVTSPGFDLVFTDTIDNATGLPLDGRGLYRVVLTEDQMGVPGRRWELYRLDAAGATSVTVHFPDLAPDPVPLQTGAALTTVQISSFAWPSFPLFDPMDALPDVFLWTDVGREVEAYAHSAPVPFTLN